MNGPMRFLLPLPTIWRTAVKGTDLKLSAGKEDPVEFDSSLTLCSDIGGVVIGGRFTNNEIPLLLSSLYLSNDGGTAAASSEVRVLSDSWLFRFRRQTGFGSTPRLETPVMLGVWLGGGPHDEGF